MRAWIRFPGVCLATCVLTAGCGGVAPRSADLVLVNGLIVTVDDDLGRAEALAVIDDRIVAVGTDDEIREHIGPGTNVIDLEGMLAVPGFIEGHGHFLGLGRALTKLDVGGAHSWDEVVGLVADRARETPPGEWILGWGWHQEKWDRPPVPAVEGYPVHASLSAATPDHPVVLKHAAGSHAGMINARAMSLAGIGIATPDPEGGKILRDAAGRPTGVLRETAYGIALEAMERDLSGRSPEAIEEAGAREIRLADRECLSKGITSFQDAGSSFEEVDRLRGAAEAGEIGVRLWVMLRDDVARLEARAADYRVIDIADGRFTVRAIKAAIDGALGTHGAWLLEPYSDLPETSGLNTMSLDDLERIAAVAARHDLQLAVHAIGDRGNRETLDLYERAFSADPPGKNRRWRIEHAQHLHPDDIGRFSELGVIASMQGVHCTSDAPWVLLRLGDERGRSGAYRWRELIDSGAVVVNGTDTPVEDVDPIANFHASVSRQTADGSRFYPDQRMTRMEALRSYTRDAAWAAFEEDRKGTLAPGMLADVTVLSRDILTVPEEEIIDAEVVYTIVGGRVLFAREGA